VRRVVDEGEAVPLGDSGKRVHVARVAVAVDRDDGAGPLADRRLDSHGVDVEVVRPDVGEHRSQLRALYGVGRGDERVGRGDDFAAEACGVNCAFERKHAVGRKGQMLDVEEGGELRLEPLVERAVVRDELARPDFLKQGNQLFERRQERPGDVNRIVSRAQTMSPRVQCRLRWRGAGHSEAPARCKATGTLARRPQLWRRAFMGRVYSSRKRVMVTGGAGFLGSHLIEVLLNAGHEVMCVDNLFTGTKDNLAEAAKHPHFEFMRHDITWPLYVEVDEIYNLACPASPIHYQHDPVQTTKTSVHGAINMLGLAKRVGARILQASTSEVYGDPTIHPQTEGYWGNVNPIGPRSCYDEGKRCAETLFFDYHRQNAVEIKVARIFNTYGPRMHPADGRVVSNFIVQALKGDPITIFGDGSQTRSFCYVDDLIDGLIRLMESPPEVTGPINLGNPREFTIRELAEIVIEMTGSSSEIVQHPLPADDPRQRQPDIAKARAQLAWEPKVQLEEGLRNTVAYFSGLAMEPAARPVSAVKGVTA
jgi:UDP-glucuronate decarboxylase